MRVREKKKPKPSAREEQVDDLPAAAEPGLDEVFDPQQEIPPAVVEPSASQEGTGTQKKEETGEEDKIDPPKSICPFYRRGTCRYGISGKKCPKAHPKPCRKLLQHGTRKPNGCSLGNKCEKFHPQICNSSLKKGTCYKSNCQLRHVAGTERNLPGAENTASAGTGQQTGNQQTGTQQTATQNGSKDFLDALLMLERKLAAMESRMDAKIAGLVSTQTPAVQTQIHQQMPHPGIMLTDRAPAALNMMPSQSHVPALMYRTQGGQVVGYDQGLTGQNPQIASAMYMNSHMGQNQGTQQPMYMAAVPQTR